MKVYFSISLAFFGIELDNWSLAFWDRTGVSVWHRTGLSVCSHDGRYCRLLIDVRQSVLYRGLVLHPKRALMFWMYKKRDDGIRIEQAFMDGTGRRDLFHMSSRSSPTGLTMDYMHEHLYYVDNVDKTIVRIDMITLRRYMTILQTDIALRLFIGRWLFSKCHSSILNSILPFLMDNFTGLIRMH